MSDNAGGPDVIGTVDDLPGAGMYVPRGGAPRLLARGVFAVVLVLLMLYVSTHRMTPPPKQVAAAPARIAPLPQAAIKAENGLGPAGLRLLVGGTMPQILDAGAGRLAAVPDLNVIPESTVSTFPLAGRTGEVAAVTEPYGSAGGRYLARQGSAKPLLLGSDPDVLPSRDGQLILTVARPGGTAVSGFTLDRRPRWQWVRPGLVRALRDTPAGLLVQQYVSPAGGRALVDLVDPSTGRSRHQVGIAQVVLAVDDRQVALLDGCPVKCLVSVTSLADGVTLSYPMSARHVPTRAALSPDGRSIALAYPASGVRGGSTLGFVLVRSVSRDGRDSRPSVQVSGLELGLTPGAELGWSKDSKVLVIAVNYPEKQRFLLWQRDQPLRVLPVEVYGHNGPFTVL